MEKVDDIIIQSQAGGDGKSHGVLFILLDEYKQIKDRSGLALADAYTTDIAKVIKEKCEHLDISARFSDSCFIVLVTEKGVNETMDVADNLRKEIEHHITDLHGASASSTCSIGVVMLGDASGNAHDVVNLADHACTTAKSQGGNRVFLHQTSFDAKISQEEQTTWENTIIEAIAKDKLFLVYQPIACLQGDNMERYDIRIRLRGENNTEIRPDEFLHIAEKAQLMIDIDKWVITNTFKSLMQRLTIKPDTIFFMKLSREAVTTASMPGFIKEQAAIHKVDMSKIVFEVAEPLIVTHLNKVKEFYAGIADIGCKFAIDHFGSGLNPFQIVKHISPDYLKIDNTITQDASNSPESLEKLKSIIDSAHEMEKKVVATHLEDATSLAILWQCRVDYIQGYFLQEPSPDLNHDFNGLVI
ncbi:MAG: GGDEF domain-containing protein [Gammaproteobacteria bacterium]|nr:MAG: GGDEF domain-containing protein [Gammaproteobacteria bacterium]